MTNSTHRVEVVTVSAITEHPNADKLAITRVGRYQCIIRKGEFVPGALAAFVPPESLVPLDVPEFQFLQDPVKRERTHARIGAKRLRKEWSEGLLIPARAGWQEGDDVAGELGVQHFEPPQPPQHPSTARSAQPAKKPPGFPVPEYGVEAYKRHADLLRAGENVLVTEKIHGSNARYTYRNGVFHCGSHRSWRQRETLPHGLQWLRRVWPSKRGPGCTRWWALPALHREDAWTRALAACPQLQAYLIAHPGEVVYGEVYGDGIQDLKYGCHSGEQKFAAFDILTEDGWLPQAKTLDRLQMWRVPIVPTLYCGPLDHEAVMSFAEGLSVIPGAGHMREGCVVVPIVPREDPRCGGRVVMKIVSRTYLERGL